MPFDRHIGIDENYDLPTPVRDRLAEYWLTDEDVRDTIGATLVPGAGVTITPDDAADTITIAATGGGGGSDDRTSFIYVEDLLPDGWVSGDPDGGALAAACANGGRVILPPGRLIAEQPVVPTRTLVLEGAGGNFHSEDLSPSVVEFLPGLNGITFNTFDTVGSTLRGFHLTSQEDGVGVGMGVLIMAGRVTLEDLTVTEFGSHGVHIDSTGSTNAHVINTIGVNTIRGNGGDGLRITGQANASTFTGLDIALNGGWGINNGGRSNVFLHPHILSNTGGAIIDQSIGNAYIFPYVEADVGAVMDVVKFTAASSSGFYFMTGYGGKDPVTEGAAGTSWTIWTPQRFRRHIKIGAQGGLGTGKSSVIDQGVYGTDTGRLRMEAADGSTSGTSLMRWGDALLESMLEHRFVQGLRLSNGSGPIINSGAGVPALSASIGSLYLRTDGAAGTTLYVREATGWVPK